jgi:glycosyltransferase involved in cell wall biosynthesis
VGVLAFVPVYNEETHIAALLDRFRPVLDAGTVQEVVVVDDASTDQTPTILRRYPDVTVITQPSNQGIGSSIRVAYRRALQRNYDVFVIMAGNGKDDPTQIGSLLAPVFRGDADYVQGSRFLPGGQSQGLPRHRYVAMRTFSMVFSLMVRHHFSDCTNGFRAYRTAILRDDRIGWLQSWLGQGYELEYYIHYKVAQLGYRMTEVPVSKIYRRAPNGSYSKIRWADWPRMLRPLLYLRLGFRQ